MAWARLARMAHSASPNRTSAVAAAAGSGSGSGSALWAARAAQAAAPTCAFSSSAPARVGGRFEPEFTAPVPVKSRAAPEQPAGEIFDRIMHNMGVGRTAKLTELHRLCNSVSKERDAELLEQAITRFRQKLVESTERTALLTALALSRLRKPEVAVRIFKDPKTYGLFPSRRALHGLLLRIGTDIKDAPAKLASVYDAMELFTLHGREPTPFTRACLLRACVHARTPEGLKGALDLLKQPTTEQDLITETSFAFWVTKLLKQLTESGSPEAKEALTTVQTRLREIRTKSPKDFPAALDVLIQ